MVYIFLDESGDLGFNFKKKKTSRYFIITALLTKNKTQLEKIVKKIFRDLAPNEIKTRGGTLHAHKESPKTRQKLLGLFHNQTGTNIAVIYIKKQIAHTNLFKKKHHLYSQIINELLSRICEKELIPKNEILHIYASRRETNRSLNTHFSSYLKKELETHYKISAEICVLSPSAEKGLQVADMISWSIFRKYEHGDITYYETIAKEIIEENQLHP